jgi:hypothetical protein
MTTLIQIIAIVAGLGMDCRKSESENNLQSFYIRADKVTSLKDEIVNCGTWKAGHKSEPYNYCMLFVDKQYAYATLGKCDRIADKINKALKERRKYCE